ncbi:hypothetical protein WJX82_008502 [Trebouxia sp. C0006]
MSLRKGVQLLAPRLGDQGARYLAAPLCRSAASLPLPSSDDRSPVCSSCIPAFSRGFSSNSALAPTTSGLPPTQHVMKNPTNIIDYDEHSHERFAPGDPGKRAFTYFVLTGGRFIYASAIRLGVLKFILSMTATADVLAMASLEVDLANIEPGNTITVKWRGKPVFVKHRTEEEIGKAKDEDISKLRDPQADDDRTQKPEWLVVVGVCTHLGCVPLPNAGDWGGWFCPCHGSHYDLSGRARKGPAPYNLEVPEYSFTDDTTLVVG